MKKNYERAAEALDHKLAKYLEKVGISNLDANTPEQTLKWLLAVFVKDFLDYQLFFDDFSSLCEKLLVVLQNKKNESDSDLFMICHYGAELSWYIRNEPERAANFMQTILNFYEKNLLQISNTKSA